MKTKVKYVLPAFVAVFALMFAAVATPYAIAEPGQEKQWADGSSGDGAYDHSAKKDIKQDMAEKLNSYCEMSADEQTATIAEHDKTEEMVAKMNEYCSLDEAGKQAFIEEHKDEYKKHSENKMRHDSKKDHHHMTIKVEGFTGAIPIPEMTEQTDMKAVHDDLKSQVTVKFSEAAVLAEDAGLDVMKGSIGMAVNEDGNKFVVWMLAEMNMDDSESDNMSTTVFVVDAADATNTIQVTKEYDHSKMMAKEGKDKRYSHDKQQQGDNYEETLSDPEQIENKIAKIEEKLSDGGTGNVSKDDLKSQFLDVLKQLQNAIADGDDAQADSLRAQLNDLRSQMTEMKWHN